MMIGHWYLINIGLLFNFCMIKKKKDYFRWDIWANSFIICISNAIILFIFLIANLMNEKGDLLESNA